jgi:hypothetical protein
MLPARTPFRPSQIGTVPETPSPGDLPAQQAAAAAHAARRGGGAGRQFVDNTPSKGRVPKAQRVEAGMAGGVGGGEQSVSGFGSRGLHDLTHHCQSSPTHQHIMWRTLGPGESLSSRP